MSPIVVVSKENGKLRVCIKLKNINAMTLCDYYSLLINEHVLERVVGRKSYSFIDDFFGYNQVSIKEEDQQKNYFCH